MGKLLPTLGLKLPVTAPVAAVPAARSAASSSSTGSGGGAGGGGGDLTDAQRILKLKEWARNKLVSGDSAGLEQQLRNKLVPDEQLAARAEFDAIRKKVEGGQKVVIAERDVAPVPGAGGRERGEGGSGRPTEAISDRNKKRLKDLGLEKLGLSDADIESFGQWLDDNHHAGDTANEPASTADDGGDKPAGKKKKGQKGKKTPKPSESHEHLKTPAQVAEAVEKWKQSTGRSKTVPAEAGVIEPTGRKPDPGKGGKGGGGNEGGSAPAGSPGGTGNAPADGAQGAAGNAKSAEAMQAEATAYAEKAAKLERAAKTIETDTGQLEDSAAKSRKRLLDRKATAEQYFEDMKTLDRQRLAVDTRRKQLAGEATALKGEAEATVARMVKTMPKEMETAFHSENPKEILARGHVVTKTGVTAAGLLNVFNAVMTGYEIVQSVQYVLDAGSVMEGVGRAVEVGGKFAAGMIEGELLALVAGSAAGGMGLGLLLQMPSDQGGDAERQEEAARQEAEQAHVKKMKHDEMLAVGRFLEKTAPGSVEWVEDTYYVKNRALWDKTVAELHELQAAYFAKQYATLRQRAYDLGRDDGRFSNDFLRVDEIKRWKEVKDSGRALVLSMDLFEDYKQGHKAGNVLLLALQERATQLGYADAKAGKPRDARQVNAWPEISKAMMQGANPITLMAGLAEAYGDAWDAIRKKK